MLDECLFTKIEEEDISNIWLQQGGATCHPPEATLDVLCPVFEDRIISLEFLFTKTENKDIGNFWIQQDGATCHTDEATLDVLLAVFENRIISRWELMSLGHLGAMI